MNGLKSILAAEFCILVRKIRVTMPDKIIFNIA